MMGYLGAAAFTAVFGDHGDPGRLQPAVRGPGGLDMIGAVVVWVLARKPGTMVVDAVPVTPPLSTAPSGA